MPSDILASIRQAVIEGNPGAAAALAEQAIKADREPLVVIEEGLTPAMQVVGEKFEAGEYFLPHLIMAANAMKQAMAVLEPELHARQQEIKVAGTVVIGTVAGDIHEIGKSLVATMLSANGFEVHDLGVDVAVETFVDTVRETGANLLGMSALLTTTKVAQQEVIEALMQAGLREQVIVLVGGAPVTQEWAARIGADGYAEDALGAVRVAHELLAR
jgi:corrinoid protein of di/trimethylamine methyltransferase